MQGRTYAIFLIAESEKLMCGVNSSTKIICLHIFLITQKMQQPQLKIYIQGEFILDSS